jgi:hypothetical protein
VEIRGAILRSHLLRHLLPEVALLHHVGYEKLMRLVERHQLVDAIQRRQHLAVKREGTKWTSEHRLEHSVPDLKRWFRLVEEPATHSPHLHLKLAEPSVEEAGELRKAYVLS